jgi:ribosomal protein S18 acetylase RimI-like enzyme
VPEELPQLRLGFNRFEGLSPPEPVDGYGLRTFRPGDENAWVAILNTAGFGEWDLARIHRMLSGDRSPLPYEGIFFATHRDDLVGVASCFFYRYETPPAAEIGWVAVLPEHHGRRLAQMICAAALNFIRDRRYTYAFLKTEPHRTAAIKTYLALGFEPEMVHPAHEQWWQDFRQKQRV